MKTIGVLATTLTSGALSVWIFSLFGAVTFGHEFLAGAVSAGVLLLALLVSLIISEESNR